MGMKRARIIVSGIVQGVFFRSSSRYQALHLGLKGWVKNRTDGKVEIVAEGENDAIMDFIQWCHLGPPGARVDHVDLEWEDYIGEFPGFSIRYSDHW